MSLSARTPLTAPTASGRPAGTLPWLARHLLSFEVAFALFLYSNELRVFLPQAPVDETLLLGALSMAAGGVIILRHGIRLRGLHVLAAMLLFVGWVVLSYGWTPGHGLARRNVLYIAGFGTWATMAGALIVAGSRERVVRFLGVVLVLGLVFAVVGLYVYLTYGTFRNWEGWRDVEVGRIHQVFGYVVADAAVVALALAMFARLGRGRQLLGLALFGVCLFFLLVGGARGPLLGVGLAALVPLLLGLQASRGRLVVSQAQLVGLAVLVVAGGYVAFLVATGELAQTLGRFSAALDQLENPDVSGGFNRAVYWPKAIEFWRAAPVVGQGIGSFSTLLYGVEIPGTHPHNFVLQILAELGLVGLGLYALFIYSAGRGLSLARLRSDPVLLCSLFYCLSTMMLTLVSRDLAGGWKLFFAFALLAQQTPPPRQPRGRAQGGVGRSPRSPARRSARSSA